MNKITPAIALLVFAGISRMSVAATVPGFSATTPTIDASSGHLLVNFTEEGLVNENVQLAGTAVAHIVTRTGKSTDIKVNGTAMFAVPGSGVVSSRLEFRIAPPADAASITFSDIQVEDVTNGIPAEVDESVSRSFMEHGLKKFNKGHFTKHNKLG